MPAGIAPLHPSILSKGVHIYEPFGGSDISILYLHLECGDFVGTYTTQVESKADEQAVYFALQKAQRQFPGQLPDSAIAGCCSRLGSNIIEETAEPAFRRLINERGQIDIVGGN